jgi:RNA polymerase sigma-70 factor (sigma-E family)
MAGNEMGQAVDFEPFVVAQLPALLRYAAMLTNDRELAQDVVQDVLVRAHARWRRIGAVDRPELYLRRMVTNEYLSWRRRKARRATTLGRWGSTLVITVVADHADGTVNRSALNQLLTVLPPRQRAVLILGYYEGRDDAEIARLLGCSAGSVRSYRSRALAALRSVLSDTVLAGEDR